jgi:CubicO group peptidase (beta-lactamase class C family)
MLESAEASGSVAPGLEPVREAFAQTLAGGGGAFAAWDASRRLVDLWGGVADTATQRPWTEDTLQLIFSGSKGLVAACLLVLVDRGELAFDVPVARYWPAFAQAGKEEITVAQVVSHRAGLAGIAKPIERAELLDPDHMAAILAAQAPFWPDDNPLAYHALTYGWLCHGLVRSITGKTIGSLFREAFGDALDLEVWIGLPGELESRVSQLIRTDFALGDPLRYPEYGKTIYAPDLFGAPLPWNEPAWHQAEIPAGNAIGTAAAIARFYACLANGGASGGQQLLAPVTIDLGCQRLSQGRDAFFDDPLMFGAGFELQIPELPRYGPEDDAFGHSGAGGSIHGAWPRLGVGFSYCTNVMRAEEADDRGRNILRCLHACLEERT